MARCVMSSPHPSDTHSQPSVQGRVIQTLYSSGDDSTAGCNDRSTNCLTARIQLHRPRDGSGPEDVDGGFHRASLSRSGYTHALRPPSGG